MDGIDHLTGTTLLSLGGVFEQDARLVVQKEVEEGLGPFSICWDVWSSGSKSLLGGMLYGILTEVSFPLFWRTIFSPPGNLFSRAYWTVMARGAGCGCL